MDERALEIGLVAPPWVPVPPTSYGGTELVIDHLARGLQAAGHRVRLFTTGDSTCPVRRSWLLPRAVGTTGSLLDELAHVQAAYGALASCDVIHDHTLLGPLLAAARRLTVPVVTTAHGEFTHELTEHYRTVAPTAAVVAISQHQRDSAPSVPVEFVIHHGIDVDRIPAGSGDGGYVLFLGRMAAIKGVHRAVRVARAARKRLVIAAKMWEPAEREYYERRVRPLLGDDAEFVGQVGGTEKWALVGGAEALVNPIRWPEPFGLVMIEALAAGTPVVTFAEGAAPEIVDDGVTGFVCRDEAEMIARLGEVGSLDRRACRRVAEQRFCTARMVDDHVRAYRTLIGRAERPPVGAAVPQIS